jgi:hypothetical protein
MTGGFGADQHLKALELPLLSRFLKPAIMDVQQGLRQS